MILKHFFEERLAQSSYLVGCGATGHAVVIDPTRRPDQYIAAAAAEGLRITAVAETHLHADYASGALALARQTAATLHVSGAGGPAWEYELARQPRVRALRHGDTFAVGRVRFDVHHTPGHTPEHLAYLVTDEAAASQPLGAFTGDFLFVGDVGRPDLLEKALGQRRTAEAAAKQLFASLRAFAAQPDILLLWPAHGAGSACGRSLGGVPVSTMGYEKLTNWAFKAADEAAFVRSVLADQPDPPRHFKAMKALNRAGCPPPGRRRKLRRITPSELEALVLAHAEFIDIRPQAAAAGHLQGSIVLPLTRQFLTWAGSVLRYGMPVYVVASDIHDAHEAADALGLIGIDDIRGWVPELAVEAYARAGGPLDRLATVDAREAIERQARGHLVLDVRSTGEWQAGYIADARHAPLASLLDDVRELDRDRPLVVYCQAGARSQIAATALRRVGFTHVASLADGYQGFLERERAGAAER